MRAPDGCAPEPIVIVSFDPWALAGVALGTASIAYLMIAIVLVRRHPGVSGSASPRARRFGVAEPPLWLVPLRECLCFAVWTASLIDRGVDWRGRRFWIAPDGTLLPSALETGAAATR